MSRARAGWTRAALVLGLLVWAPISGATTVAPLSLEEQVKKADVVLHVRIAALSQETRTLGRDALPWQVYTLEVLATLAGDAAALPQKDGKPSVAILGGPELTLEGAPTLKAPLDKEPGGEYILMLYKTPFDSPIVGFNQGIYAVNAGQVQNLPGNRTPLENADLTAFKNQVIALRGAQ